LFGKSNVFLSESRIDADSADFADFLGEEAPEKST